MEAEFGLSAKSQIIFILTIFSLRSPHPYFEEGSVRPDLDRSVFILFQFWF